MSEDQTRKRARNGTKSCTECRRRKVRCIRVSEDAPTCRRCEERGATCTAQIYSNSRPVQAPRLPSRFRISQLESKVASLTKAIHDIELKRGCQPTVTSEPTEPNRESSPEEDISDDDSSVVDVPPAERPSHLRSLFQNDWLSVDTSWQTEQVQERQAKASAHLLNEAKTALEKLIPSKEEFLEIASCSPRWLELLQTLLPQPFTIKSQQELLESYDGMIKPDVDAFALVTWLLILALTAPPDLQVYGSPASQSSKAQGCSVFTRAVSGTVENTILSHGRLVGTVQGLGVALHFIRLQLSLENFQKAWLRLRYVIAISELMGLPKTSQAVEFNRLNGVEDETLFQKAQLWEAICSADRIFSMVMNLPAGTRRYQRPMSPELIVDGVVQPRGYLSRMTNISIRVQDLDDVNAMGRSKPDIYATALKIDRELKELASHTPKAWWALDEENVKADIILQFLHHCTTMRLHLPFAMRQDPGGEYIYSRVACLDACELLAQLYMSIRRKLPINIFISRLLDLQAFAAAVVLLLLTSHGSPPMDRFNLRSNATRIENLVAQVVDTMNEKSSSSNVARQAVGTIRALYTLLQRDGSNPQVPELKLKVPLLGNVHIHRNVGPSQKPNGNFPPSSQAMMDLDPWKPSAQIDPQQYAGPSLTTDTLVQQTAQQPGQWQWDPLSWSVDDYNEDFFQDALMAESLDPFDTWQNGVNVYQNFQFSSG